MTSLESKVPLNDNAACESCGRFGAIEIGERRLCPDCYESAGSCCPEFGKDDRWQDREKQNETKEA
jgi:hypothetical protein